MDQNLFVKKFAEDMFIRRYRNVGVLQEESRRDCTSAGSIAVHYVQNLPKEPMSYLNFFFL